MSTYNILILFLIFILLIILLRTYVIVINPVPVPVPVPVPAHVNKIGGCAGTRYGCCPNGITARQNLIGSNC